MFIESIILAIFVCSLGGILFILIKKIPALNSLPQNGSAGIREHKLVLLAEDKIKNILTFFKKQMFLHKLLSFIKVLTLKIETKVDVLLHKIRKKAQQVDKNNDKK